MVKGFAYFTRDPELKGNIIVVEPLKKDKKGQTVFIGYRSGKRCK